MRKKFLKYSIIFVLFMLLFIPSKALAATDYEISKYDINIVVNEDNTFDITETITAFFYEPKHRNI